MLEKALENWAALNDALRSIDERGAVKLLQRERAGQRRVQFMLRIFGRYNRLRCERERRELLQEAK